jgi:hypothetical protein
VAKKAVPAAAAAITKALTAVVNITSPAVLERMPRPRFQVKKTAGRDDNIRASAEHGWIVINVDDKVDMTTVAHEIGHVFENFLPLGCWLDLMRLLQARHTAGSMGGPSTLVAIYPGHKDPNVANEAAFRADMPAYAALWPNSSRYPAKVYPQTCVPRPGRAAAETGSR